MRRRRYQEEDQLVTVVYIQRHTLHTAAKLTHGGTALENKENKKTLTVEKKMKVDKS